MTTTSLTRLLGTLATLLAPFKAAFDQEFGGRPQTRPAPTPTPVTPVAAGEPVVTAEPAPVVAEPAAEPRGAGGRGGVRGAGREPADPEGRCDVTDEDALLAAVCAAPDDDLPRLVYADWLDERGQADRADFIRTQVEYARLQAGAARVRHPHLNGRAAKLLRRHKDSWTPQLFHRKGVRVHWRRGFVWKLELPTDLWLRHHAGGWTFSAAAVSTAPLGRVLLTDRAPFMVPSGRGRGRLGQWHHFDGTPGGMASWFVLPSTLFDRLADVKPEPVGVDDGDVTAPIFEYASGPAAAEALSQACLKHGRDGSRAYLANRAAWDEHGRRPLVPAG